MSKLWHKSEEEPSISCRVENNFTCEDCKTKESQSNERWCAACKSMKPLKDFNRKYQHQVKYVCYSCEQRTKARKKWCSLCNTEKFLHQCPLRDPKHRAAFCEECRHPPCETCGAKIMEPPHWKAKQKRKYCSACC